MGALIVLGVLAVIVVVLGGIAVGMYNSLVRIRNHCEESWSDVETEMQRRYDLIPNLVNTVKGYASHEKELLEEVTRLREQCASNQGSPQEQAQTEGLLQGALGKLMVRLEAYPDLKANQNFLALQEELSSTENRIAFARQAYNDAVMRLNTKIESFPANLVAGPFGFTRRSFFELEDPSEREVPEVKF